MSENQEPYVFHVIDNTTTSYVQPFTGVIPGPGIMPGWSNPPMVAILSQLNETSLEAIRQIVQDEVQKALHPEPEASDYNEEED